MADDASLPVVEDLPPPVAAAASAPVAQVLRANGQRVSAGEKLTVAAYDFRQPLFLSEQELENTGEDLEKICIYWCAKEALYKVYGKRGLHFASQLLVEPFILEEKGNLKGMINMQEVKLNVALCYEIEPEFVVVYTNPH